MDVPVPFTLLFYTDGLSEQSANGQIFREELKKLFTRFYLETSDSLIHKINERFKEFAGTTQGEDDITIMAVRTFLD